MANAMTIARHYVSKTHGDIGSVELDVPTSGWKFDGKDLPEASIRYLVFFSLQCLQDAYGKRDLSLDEAVALWAKKRDKIIEGSVGTRTASGMSERDYVTCMLLRPIMKASPDSKAGKAFAKIEEKADQDEFLIDYASNFDDDHDFWKAVEAKVQERAAEREKRKAEKDSLASIVDLDI